MITVGIIGYGFVGKATSAMRLNSPIVIYDKFIDEHKDNSLSVVEQDVVFVCVPTNLNGKKLDLSAVKESVELWEKRSNREGILVIKSTIPVGVTEDLITYFGTDRIVFNPEFLTERTANTDFLHADEVIIGTINQEAAEKVSVLYRDLLGPGVKIKITTPKVAELIKMARNSLYAIKVEYMNELFDLCEVMGIDYSEFRENFVWEGKNAWVLDQHTHVPGPDGFRGFGGKCLPKDSRDLYTLFEDYNIKSPVLKGAIVGNKGRR